jgi:hypothetical protein
MPPMPPHEFPGALAKAAFTANKEMSSKEKLEKNGLKKEGTNFGSKCLENFAGCLEKSIYDI